MPTQNEIDSRLFPSDRRPRADHVTSASRNGSVLDVHAPEGLDIMEASGLYIVQSAKYAARLTFDRLTDQRGGVSAEVTVVLGSTEILSGVDIGLKSDTGHTKLAASLRALAPTEPWKQLLQKACALVLQQHRRGDPPQQLTRSRIVEPLTYSINPFLFKRKTTIIYGDGGLGKSTFALFLGMCVALGATVAGIAALRGKVLYLDYEDDADVHTRRLHAIMQGHPELNNAEVLYQRCTEPLSRLAHSLVRRIQAEGISFVILDSLMAGTGGDASAESTAKLFAALRVLAVEVLALGHVPKTQAEGAEHLTVYGSVFNQNFARAVWEIKKEQAIGEDGSVLGLFNRKSNLSRLHLPIGLSVTQNPESTCIRYASCDLSQATELAASLPLPNRIRNLLEDGTSRTSKQIAEELGAKLPSVKSALSRQAGHKWMMLGGSGQETTWTVLRPK